MLVQTGQGHVFPRAQGPRQRSLGHGEGVRSGLRAGQGALEAGPAGAEALPVFALRVGQVAFHHGVIVQPLRGVALGAQLALGGGAARGAVQTFEGVELGREKYRFRGVGIRAAGPADGLAFHEPGELWPFGVKNQVSPMLFDAFLTSGFHEPVSTLGDEKAVRVPVYRLERPVLERCSAVLLV